MVSTDSPRVLFGIRRLHHVAAAVAGGLLLVCLAAAPGARASAPTLGGEAVLEMSSAGLTVEPGSSCNPDGSGTINFSASGTASGPYPGTFAEHGSLTLGPRPPQQGGIVFRAPVTSFDAVFSITSGSTRVDGSATLGERADMLPFGTFDFQNQGECLLGAFTADQFGVGIRYTATIATASSDGDAMANARNLVSNVESCFTDTQDYALCREPPQTGLPLGSQPGEVEVTDANTYDYVIVAHSLSGNDFTITKNTNGVLVRTCSAAGQGSCASDGSWIEFDVDSGFGQASGAYGRFLNPATLISQQFASLTGVSAPPAPGPVIAAAGDSSAVVSWVPPSSNGGSPIRTYVITASPGGQTATACSTPAPQCAYTSLTIDGLTNGVDYTFTVVATNAAGSGAASAPTAVVTPAAGNAVPQAAIGDASATAPTTVATGGTPAPGEATTQITVPAGTAGGLVSLVQATTSGSPPGGYTFLGRQMHITAPVASAADPLVLVFALDEALLTAAGVDASTIQVFRDGVPIAPCAAAVAADPDPCVADRSAPADGGATLTVRSSHASTWSLGKRNAFTISGLFAPIDPRPTVNTAKSGSAVPIKFSLNGFQGFAVLAAGYPKSAHTVCNSALNADPIEQLSTATPNRLSYDAASDRYTYVWKTEKDWSTAPAGPCRQLVVRFADGSERRADFRFAK